LKAAGQKNAAERIPKGIANLSFDLTQKNIDGGAGDRHNIESMGG
jgi:hypothetical protein